MDRRESQEYFGMSDSNKNGSNEEKEEIITSPERSMEMDADQSSEHKVRKQYFPIFKNSSEEEEDEKSRTPSGNVITNTIKATRSIFSPKVRSTTGENSVQNDSQENQPSVEDSISDTARNQSTVKEFLRNGKTIFNKFKRKRSGDKVGDKTSTTNKCDHDEARNDTKRRPGDQTKNLKTGVKQNEKTGSDIESDCASELSSPSKELLLHVSRNMKEVTYDDFKKDLQQSDMDSSRESDESLGIEKPQEMEPSAMSQHQTEDKMPETITLQLIWQMFTELKRDNQQLKESNIQDNQGLTEACIEAATKVASDTIKDYADAESENTESIEKLKKELKHYKHKSQVLTDICNRMYTEVGDLTQRLENLELNNSKRMVMVTGLSLPNTEMKKGDIIDFLTEFFLTNLGLQVRIEDTFFLGLLVPKPIVIEFQSAHDKRAALKYKNLLKNYRSATGKVYVNDYTPLATQEKRKRDRKIRTEVEEVSPGAEIKYTKAGLTLRGTPYRKKVLPPTPKELVNLTVKELDEVLRSEYNRSENKAVEGSIFTGFAAPAKNHDDVRRLYQKLKLKIPDARHIVCAYVLKDVSPHYNAADCHDDGEHGAGRILLELLESNGLTDVMIFVARRYGGVKMSGERFKCYLEVAKEALDPDNTFIKLVTRNTAPKQQVFQSTVEQDTERDDISTYPHPHLPNKQGRQQHQHPQNSHNMNFNYAATSSSPAETMRQPQLTDANLSTAPQPLPQRDGAFLRRNYAPRSGDVRAARASTQAYRGTTPHFPRTPQYQFRFSQPGYSKWSV